jgi:hypothetical protein
MRKGRKTVAAATTVRLNINKNREFTAGIQGKGF